MTVRRVDAAPAEVLRTAATVLRELAAEATPGMRAIVLGAMREPTDNVWVATLHPGIAEPLSEALECAANGEESGLPYPCLRSHLLALARVILGGDGR
jgi:hypothetical protein